MVDPQRATPMPTIAPLGMVRKLRRILDRSAGSRPRGRPRRVPTDAELRDALRGIMDRAVSRGPQAAMQLAIAMLDGPLEIMPALAQNVLRRCCVRHGWKD